MKWWTDHGTKILGGAIAVCGALATPEVIAALGPWGPRAAVIFAGAAVFLRGIQNSQVKP